VCIAGSSAGVSICTFVPVKLVSWACTKVQILTPAEHSWQLRAAGVSICTFVLVKLVKWVPGSAPGRCVLVRSMSRAHTCATTASGLKLLVYEALSY